MHRSDLLLKVWGGVLAGSILLSLCVLTTWALSMPAGDSSAGSYFGMAAMLLMFRMAFLSLSAAPLMLNRWNAVWRHRVFQALSFFLLPLVLCLLDIVPSLRRGDVSGASMGLTLLYAPFFVCLTVGYVITFRRLRKNPEWHP